ncbi:unnamed protein product [Linum tenue]|uniref:Uncharacterized protein n=1 Tax=Linum tenue TaxID=586396 RepID=A0AAV0LBD9_9ROSI|nr:unnamed protein product [Linum tenue]
MPGEPPTFRLTEIRPPQPNNKNDNLVFTAGRVETGVSGRDDRRGIQIPRVCGQQLVISGARDVGFVPDRRGGNGVELGVRAPPPPWPERRDEQGAVENRGDEADDREFVTVVEQEANRNGPVFVDRFMDALQYYSSLFNSLEGSSWSSQPASQNVVMSEMTINLSYYLFL